MSRSYHKHPKVHFIGYNSNKEDRSIANRKMRRANKQLIQNHMSFNKELYPDGVDLYDCDNNPMWYDWWEQWPIEETLTNADFKILREASDVWGWASDGLPHTISMNQLIWDWSYPTEKWDTTNHPQTTLAIAKKEHNWQTLKHYYSK